MKILNSFVMRLAALFALIILFSGTTYAVRVDQYPVTPIPSNFSSIVSAGGTIMPNGNISYANYYTNWDGGTSISMPFTFVFDEQTYTAGSPVYAHMGSINFEYWNTTGTWCYCYGSHNRPLS